MHDEARKRAEIVAAVVGRDGRVLVRTFEAHSLGDTYEGIEVASTEQQSGESPLEAGRRALNAALGVEAGDGRIIGHECSGRCAASHGRRTITTVAFAATGTALPDGVWVQPERMGELSPEVGMARAGGRIRAYAKARMTPGRKGLEARCVAGSAAVEAAMRHHQVHWVRVSLGLEHRRGWCATSTTIADGDAMQTGEERRLPEQGEESLDSLAKTVAFDIASLWLDRREWYTRAVVEWMRSASLGSTGVHLQANGPVMAL